MYGIDIDAKKRFQTLRNDNKQLQGGYKRLFTGNVKERDVSLL